jgi:beta-lactamase class A
MFISSAIEKAMVVMAFSVLSIQVQLHAQHRKVSALEKELESVIAPYKATVGIAVIDIERNEHFQVNGGRRYPMQSVFKFPLAICILDMVDHGRLRLDEKVHIKKEKLDKDTWGPLVDDHPDQDIDISIQELLRYSVSKSDNNACDILFSLAGGPKKVNEYIHDAGINDIAIVATEGEMKIAWQVQYTNWCQPDAMAELLRLFFGGNLLSTQSNELLMNLMTKSENSEKRIKGLLPQDAKVAHKTGTSGANKAGLRAATNDVGIITLPNGHHIALVVFVSDFKGMPAYGEQIIAQVAGCVWNHFTKVK